MARYKTYYQKGREKIIADNNMNPVLVHAELAHHDLRATLNYIDIRLRDGDNFSLFDMQYIDGTLREVENNIKEILTRGMIDEHNKSNDTT
jgi:hypothetical protein